MTRPFTPADPLQQLPFFVSPPHACSYLPDRAAVTLFADPDHAMTMELYARLARHGFRRSGTYVYRPACPDCRACQPVRVDVERFRPSRNLRRIARRNRDLRVQIRPMGWIEEHYALYRRYAAARHPDGGMDGASADAYRGFFDSPWSDTRLVEFREGERLRAVAVMDVWADALSAVYAFYDPDLPRRSLGTYAILWEIEHARTTGRRWLYLGYWIRECDKMAYKSRFQPLEVHRNGRWQPLEADAAPGAL